MVMYVKLYLTSVAVFFITDMLWLGVIARPVYKKYLGHLMKEHVNWTAAIIFYLLFLIGLLIFVIVPAHERGSTGHAALYGALYGFFTYLTYELTNYAVIQDWPFGIVIVDIIWGAVLCCVVSTAVIMASRVIL